MEDGPDTVRNGGKYFLGSVFQSVPPENSGKRISFNSKTDERLNIRARCNGRGSVN